MTSLYPGTLFYTPGLNRRSTPTKAGTTSEELAKRYKRLPYNGRPWPAPSPVAGVYDISNSSTQLIIMNNKVRKKSKLRGHNDPDQESDRLPNPERHSRNPTPVNKEFHTKCLNSQSPRYTPSVCSELEWNNNSQRSPAKFFDGSPVNPKRHTACRVPSDPKAFQIGMLTDSPRRSSSRLSLPARFQSSPLLTHPELKPGERAYLTHIARIYSAGQMMKLKQAQYNQLLFKEMEKGLYGRDEVERYGRFINMGKDRQYQMLRPATGFRRVMSAPPEKYHVYDSTTTYSNNDDSFSTEKSSDLKNNSSDEKEGKRPKTVRPKSTRERQLSPRSKTQQAYKTAPEIPPTRTSKGSASKPNVKVNRNQNSSKVGKEEEKKQVSPATTSSDSSSDNNRLEEGSSSHREGVDRPKSRLGHASAKTADNESGSSLTMKDDGNTSSDESQGQQKLSMEESKGQQRSSDDSDSQKRSSQEENQQRSSDNSEGQQRSSDNSEGQQRSSDNSEGQQRSSDNSEGQQRSSSDEEKGQFKPSVEESTGQETSVTEEYSQDDDHNTKSDYTTSEETQPTKSTTENTYTSQRTQEKSEVYSSSATQDITPQDNTESSNEDTYTMTYESSATNQPTDNTMSDPRNLSTEKSSSAEDKTTTNYTDDSKAQQSRRDSLETDDLDDPRRVNKDVDKIEY
ncbi:dentin sialophosphoprotein-like [Ylistrum balloti]|uniref:dentin sialophosphoprotein-like n=1 Tax=Ylistrum balloti TaxID=509963 RepID=UPI0029058F24|nr:dentin sialophosphoprotein-like [Ylistrum balloti]